MAARLFRATDSHHRQVDDNTHIIELMNEMDSPECSVVTAELHGVHPRVMNRRSTTMYFITQGSLEVLFDDETITAKLGDIVRVPPNTWRKLRSDDAEFAIICAPAWRAEDDVY